MFFHKFSAEIERGLVQNSVHCICIVCMWVFLQGVQLRHNASEGIILTNRSLVLQSIDRKRSGGYVCQAVNGVGRGSSQPIVLDVKCKTTNALLLHELHCIHSSQNSYSSKLNYSHNKSALKSFF